MFPTHILSSWPSSPHWIKVTDFLTWQTLSWTVFLERYNLMLFTSHDSLNPLLWESSCFSSTIWTVSFHFLPSGSCFSSFGVEWGQETAYIAGLSLGLYMAKVLIWLILFRKQSEKKRPANSQKCRQTPGNTGYRWCQPDVALCQLWEFGIRPQTWYRWNTKSYSSRTKLLEKPGRGTSVLVGRALWHLFCTDLL